MTSRLPLLNVGCGSTFHPQWTNVDFHVASSEVISWDIRRGLPFADGVFQACYSSHVLEHLTPSEGIRLLNEFHRVLAPGGVVRVVVPDLELIARDYLRALERALNREPGADDDYDWMVIQLLDQSVRRAPGGAMSEFWRDITRRNNDFVIARAGVEAEREIAESRRGAAPRQRSGLFPRPLSRTPGQLARILQRRIARALVAAVAGPNAARAFDEGVFRNSGEIHQWMYDRYSLERSLKRAGFVEVRVVSATESLIPAFGSFELDTFAGRVRKPDSLFLEAVRDVNAASAAGPGSRGAR